jgi:hypothetical protein
VTVVQEEGHAVLFGGNGIILGDLERLKPGDLQLIAAGGPGFGLNPPFQDQGRFLGEAVELLKVLLREPTPDHHSLDQAGAVPDYQKTHFAAGAQVD